MTRRKKITAGSVVRVIGLVFYFLMVALPIYWMLITSFKTSSEIVNAQHITYWPGHFTLENYRNLFETMDFGVYLKNSLVVAVSVAVVVTIISVYGGYALARFKFRGKGTVLVFFLITQMIPAILVIIPLYVVFSKIGLIDNLLSLFIFYTVSNLPFCVITMRSFFERIPYALEESAFIDGCTRGQAIRKIVLPVMFPGIVATFVFAFIGAWNELIAAVIFMNSQMNWTIPVGLKSLIGKYNVDWGTMMAGGCLSLIPTAIMFIFVQKYIVEGMTAGAVKG